MLYNLHSITEKKPIQTRSVRTPTDREIELPCLSNGIYAYKISFEKDIFCGMLNVIQDEK